jgi:lysophospholipase L1-like esterase
MEEAEVLKEGIFMQLANTHAKLSEGRDFSIVYMGGSITQAGSMRSRETRFDGYRDHITAWLKELYPQAHIHDRHAAVAGTGSEMGVLRMEKDVLPYKPDLVFVEFAVNDGGTDVTRIERCMEGIVRQIWKQDPMTDIVFLYTMNKGMFHSYAKETPPGSIRAHERIAAHYGIPTVSMGYDFYLWEQKNEMPWNEYFMDDSHPNGKGHKVYGDVVAKELTPLLAGIPAAHALPALYTSHPWSETHFVYAKDIPHEGWTEEDIVYWGYDLTFVSADKPGVSLTYSFEGNLIAVYWNLAMDTGDVEYSIDGGAWRRSPTWDGWVVQAPQRINYKVWADNLADGPHTVTLRITDGSQWTLSEGNNIRLVGFMTAKYE